MASSRFLTLREVIGPEHLNCSESTLRRMLARNDFVKPIRLSGRALRFDLAAVQKWMERRAQEGGE
jgi:excisionase family DNA binding protein